MGNCCGGGETESEADIEEKRRLQAEAAERRLKDNEGRGLKDPEGAKRRMEQKAAAARETGQGAPGGGLKWTVNN